MPRTARCVFELGDTYSGSGGGGGDYLPGGLREGQAQFAGSAAAMRESNAAHWRQKNRTRKRTDGGQYGNHPQGGTKYNVDERPVKGNHGWPLDKSLCLLPTLYPASLAYGRNLLDPAAEPFAPWRVRNLVVWHRPNPPVGALGDKVRPSTSYVTVACTSRTRWFDLDAERGAPSPNTHARTAAGVASRPNELKTSPDGNRDSLAILGETAGAPPLDCWLDETLDDVWTLSTQPYKGSHYACVDDQTEALTPTGWKHHNDLVDGDLIASWSPDTETWHFAPATFHRYPFAGELVSIDKRITSQRLTPNHRVVYRTMKDRAPRIRRADELRPHDFVPLASAMDAGGVGPGEKAAALVGWFITEGGISNRFPCIHQSESANPEKVSAIRSLLDGIGATYTEYRREREWRGRPSVEVSFNIRGALAEWLRPFHKHLPWSAVFGWSDVDARALFDAMIDGDGHRRLDGRMSFIQKSRKTIDAFQALAVRLGYRTSISERVEGGYAVNVSPARWADLRRGFAGRESALGTEPYDGVVWCPSVDTGMWLSRRDGKPFITGNTFPITLPRKLINLMCPRQVCTTCGEPRRRITETTYEANRTTNGPQSIDRKHLDGGSAGFDVRADRVSSTVGWTDCGHNTWRRGVVLDPFVGSGTTLLAASELGRDSIGIDLDTRNLDLARHRLAESVLIVDERTDGAGTTWTVDASMPGLKGEHPDQQSLFG